MRWMQHHSMMSSDYNDGIILGQSSIKHFDENIKALENKEKLPQNIVDAFDEAWNVCKQDVPLYFKDKKFFDMQKQKQT